MGGLFHGSLPLLAGGTSTGEATPVVVVVAVGKTSYDGEDYTEEGDAGTAPLQQRSIDMANFMNIFSFIEGFTSG